MIDRLPAWFFMSIAMLLIGIALLPIVRFLVGIDAMIGIQPLTVVMLLIAGLMCGLSGMILLVRRQPKITQYSQSSQPRVRTIKLHLSGLLLFTSIPLANFLMAYWLWIRDRNCCEVYDKQGREVLNFQITIYLYLLLALFLTFVIIGLFIIPLILLVHLTLTLVAIYVSFASKTYQYPLNIPIIEGRATTDIQNDKKPSETTDSA